MPPTLHQRVRDAIRRLRMCAPGDRIAAAVSGGADSVALLLLLAELREALGVTLCVAHFHHGLRGADADADEQFARELAAAHGLEFHAERADVAAAARAHGGKERKSILVSAKEAESILVSANIEDAGRRLRYAFFQRIAAQGLTTRVATAHTADDQAETVLGHILRGTGLAGLAGIHPTAGVVIRPLLNVRRAELREFLTARGQAWREDASNQDTSRLRARIRHELLPLLEQNFQPAAVEHLAELAARARDEEVFWRELVELKYAAAVSNNKDGWSVPAAALLAPLGVRGGSPGAQAAVARRMVRRIGEAMKAASPSARGQWNAGHVKQVLRLAAESTSGRRVELPAGVVVTREFDRLVFARAVLDGPGREGTPAGPGPYEYAVALDGSQPVRVSVAETGRRYTMKVVDWPPAAGETSGLAEAMDAELLRPPVVLRSWRPGDAYRPRGSRREHKLKEIFTERRVPRDQRAAWPVLASDGRPVWTPGWPPAAEVAAGPQTRMGIVIEEEQP